MPRVCPVGRSLPVRHHGDAPNGSCGTSIAPVAAGSSRHGAFRRRRHTLRTASGSAFLGADRRSRTHGNSPSHAVLASIRCAPGDSPAYILRDSRGNNSPQLYVQHRESGNVSRRTERNSSRRSPFAAEVARKSFDVRYAGILDLFPGDFLYGALRHSGAVGHLGPAPLRSLQLGDHELVQGFFHGGRKD